MKRNKKIVFECHCLLNCNSKVEESSLYEGAMQFNKKLIDDGFGIIQLPCPEFMMYGAKRWGHTKEQFDNAFYRKECRRLLIDYINQMKVYIENSYDISGIIAIDGSPSCGYNKTCSSNKWSGELSSNKELLDKINDVKVVRGKGIFIEELISLLIENKLEIPIFAIDESDLDKSVKNLYEQ